MEKMRKRKNFRKIKGRKGDISFNTLKFLMLNVTFLFVATFALFLLLRGQLFTQIDIQGMEMEIFVQRLLYAKHGISYYDNQLQRLYPGKILLSTFNQGNFSEYIEPSIYYSGTNNLIGAKMALYDSSGNKIEILGKDGKPAIGGDIFYNKNFYQEKEVLYRAGSGFQKGRGGVVGSEHAISILIIDNGKETLGKLVITVIMQNV